LQPEIYFCTTLNITAFAHPDHNFDKQYFASPTDQTNPGLPIDQLGGEIGLAIFANIKQLCCTLIAA